MEAPSLTSQERKYLLELARRQLEHVLCGAPEPEGKPDSPALLAPGGAFVTLKRLGRLRGCIGHLFADSPLYLTVKEMAKAAALEDPRFPPVTCEELPEISIEISALSPFSEVTDVEEIVVGRDGLLLQKGPYSGLLLPQVATEYGWDKYEFLDHTCLKAGLPPGCWRAADTRIWRFSAEVFDESELST